MHIWHGPYMVGERYLGLITGLKSQGSRKERY